MLGGCKKDDRTGGGDGALSTFTLNSGSFDLKETKLTTVQESALADVAVIQFKADGTFAKYIYKSGAVTGNKLALNLTSGNAQTVVFVANVADAAFNTFTGTLTDFRAKTLAVANEAALTTGNRMVMCGEYRGAVIAGQTLAAVTMKRVTAKVLFTYSVDIPNAAETRQSFELKSVQLRNVPKVLAYAERSGVYPAASASFGDYPVVTVATTPTAASPATQTWYVTENRRGKGTAEIASQKTADALGATEGAKATYVELVGNYTNNGQTVELAYRLYLGADPVKDYNLKRNTIYKVEAVIRGANTVDMRISMTSGGGDLGVDDEDSENFTGDAVMGGTPVANCYMVNPAATDAEVIIPVRRANEIYQDKICDLYGLLNVAGYRQKDSIPEVAGANGWTAEVLWQDQSANMITITQANIKKRDDNIVIRPVGNLKGNCVVGLRRNSDAVIVWSWHIWVTDYEPVGAFIGDMVVGKMQQYAGWMADNNKTIMDRNLGAIDNTKNDKSWGLLYQWGRKDPFIGAVSGGTNQTRAWYVPNGSGGWKACTEADVTKIGAVAGMNNIYNAVMNPMTFLTSSAAPNDWTTPQNNNLWKDGAKTLFDPCPAGWRVPRKDIWAGMTAANTIWQATEKGVLVWDIVKGGPAWYPAAGFRDAGSNGLFGKLGSVGSRGHNWSSAVSGTYAMYLDFGSSWLNPSSANYRGHGFSVRCVKE